MRSIRLASCPRLDRVRLGIHLLLFSIASAVSFGAEKAGEGAPAAAPVHWQQAGWGGGGFFWCCAAHPTNANVLYLGGDCAGCYKSEDQGRHWRLINNGLASYAVYSMAMAPSDPEVLYVLSDGGICKTVDGGSRWEFLPESAKLGLISQRQLSVRALAVDPRNPRVVYAGGHKGRLAKSGDGGQSWQTLNYVAALAGSPRIKPPVPQRGRGCAVLSFDSAGGDWNRNGRIEKDFPLPGVDWSGYRKITAQVRTPPGAPTLQAQLVVQSGTNWLWQQGQFTDIPPERWTGIELDLTRLQQLQTVHFVYVVLRSPEQGYQGNVYVDAVQLHPGSPASAPLTVGDWEQPGQLEGWRANRKIADALFVTGLTQSADVGPRERGVIRTVAVSSSDPRRVFVANSEFPLLRSEDGGKTWKALQTPEGPSSVVPSPHDAGVVYAAFPTAGLLRSTDAGETWTPVKIVLPGKASVRDLVVDAADPKTLYCIVNDGWKGSFYVSHDEGQSWSTSRTMKRDRVGNPTLPEESGGGTRSKDLAEMSTLTGIAVGGGAASPIFLSGNWHNCVSADGGKTWEERIAGADITCAYDLWFHQGKTYVTAMDEGCLVSEDQGATWQQLTPKKYAEGLSGHQWRVRAWDRQGKTSVLTTVSPWAGARTYPNGVLLSLDAGQTFRKTTEGLPDYIPHAGTLWGQSYPRSLALDPRDPDVVYLAMDGSPEGEGKPGGGIFGSKDGGATWKRLPGQPEGRGSFFGLAVDPTDSRRLFYSCCGTGGGVYRSEDAGTTWELIFNNETWVFNLEVTPTGVIYCGGRNLWRSQDRGKTWKQNTRFPATPAVVVGIAVDPRNEDRVWISQITWGDAAVGGVFRTTDGGAHWEEITGDLPYRKPILLRYHPETGNLWAAGVGIYRTRQ